MYYLVPCLMMLHALLILLFMVGLIFLFKCKNGMHKCISPPLIIFAMLFNNGQTANRLCLLITYFLWRGVEGGGGPTIKSILPKYIEKKWGKASWSNTWIAITVLHREPRTNKWEYIPCHIWHDIQAMVICCWNIFNMCGKMIWFHNIYMNLIWERHMTLDSQLNFGMWEKKNWGSETDPFLIIFFWVHGCSEMSECVMDMTALIHYI